LDKLELKGGAQVDEIFQGKLSISGVRKDFIITQVGDKLIHSVDDLIETLKSAKGGVLIQGIYPNGKEGYYGLGM